MFGNLKEKLKKSLSFFSKKTAEEAEVVETPAETKEDSSKKETKTAEKPKEKVKEKKIEIKEKNKEEKTKEKESKESKVKEFEKKKQEDYKKREEDYKKDEIKKTIQNNLYQLKLFKEKEEKKYYIYTKEKIEETGVLKNLNIDNVPSELKEFLKKKQIYLSGEEILEEEEEEEEKPEEIISQEEIKSKEEPEEEIKSETVEQPKQGFFSRIKQSVTTKKISAEKFEELFWDLELVLLENNVSVEVIEKIKTDLQTELVDQNLPWNVSKKIEDTLRQTLTEILTFKKVDLFELLQKKKKAHQPLIIAFFGINGAGKTTSIAKLTHYFQQKKYSVVLAACDTFRAAAIQQLEEHADKLGVKIIKHNYGSDAAAVAFDAVKYAEKNEIDVVMIDTAGRLHSNTNLMAELEKIIRVTKPDLKIFVGESITGNDCIEQARKFNELVEMDGIILTKADIDEKGGAPLSIAYTIKKPILFLGMGQKYSDLEEFNAETILKKLGF